MAIRRGVVIGCANDSGEVCIFRQAKLAHVFSEVRHAGLGESTNAEAAPVAQIHFIGIHLEDLLFAKALLELQRNEGLGQLPAPVAVRGKEESPRHLHGNRAGSLIVFAGVLDITPRCASDANEIKSAVLEKAFVFRRKDGVHEHYREVIVAYRAPLFARAVEQIGDQLRLDFRCVKFGPALQRADAANALPAELHGQRVLPAEVGKLGWPDVHRITVYGVLAERVGIALRPVTDACQIIHQVVRSPCLRRRNVFRRGENLCGVLKDSFGNARLNHARVLHVVVSEDSACDYKNSEDNPKNRQADSGSEKPSLDPDLQKVSPLGWTSIVSQYHPLEKTELYAAGLPAAYPQKPGWAFRTAFELQKS